MRGKVARKLFLESKENKALYRRMKREWKSRNHNPGCRLRFPRVSYSKRVEAAVERGHQERMERKRILSEFPELERPFRHIQNLRRARALLLWRGAEPVNDWDI